MPTTSVFAGKVIYKKHFDDPGQWLAPSTMPRWASRLLLRVTGIEVQRVQEISAEDCIAEGFSTHLRESEAVDHLYQQYRIMWNRLNQMREGCKWNDNPWVWKFTFQRIAP
jgi:hypothetical protein